MNCLRGKTNTTDLAGDAAPSLVWKAAEILPSSRRTRDNVCIDVSARFAALAKLQSIQNKGWFIEAIS